jgi:hypothetical protein
VKFSTTGLLFILFFSSCQVAQKRVENIPVETVESAETTVVSKNESFSLAFVGDVIAHERLRQREDKTHEGYQVVWSEVQKYLDRADLRYANLEGPVAPNLGGVSGFPRFNYPEKLITSLKAGRFDVVSVANNHALDRYAKGVRQTIANLNKYKLSYTGTITDQKALETGKETWWHLSKVNGKYVAWLACTEMTNGNHDKENQVLYCFKDIEKVKQAIQELKKMKDVAAIVLLPHWGEEEEYEIDGYRKRWAHIMLNLGASAIVGSHPHVVQKIESYVTEDKRPTVIAYSLGNFVSNQHWSWTKTSMLLYLKFKSQEAYPDQFVVTEAKYIPLWMTRAIDKDGTSKFRVLPIFNLKKVPEDARLIWKEQLGLENRLKDPNEVFEFLKK